MQTLLIIKESKSKSKSKSKNCWPFFPNNKFLANKMKRLPASEEESCSTEQPLKKCRHNSPTPALCLLLDPSCALDCWDIDALSEHARLLMIKDIEKKKSKRLKVKEKNFLPPLNTEHIIIYMFITSLSTKVIKNKTTTFVVLIRRDQNTRVVIQNSMTKKRSVWRI